MAQALAATLRLQALGGLPVQYCRRQQYPYSARRNDVSRMIPLDGGVLGYWPVRFASLLRSRKGNSCFQQAEWALSAFRMGTGSQGPGFGAGCRRRIRLQTRVS